MGFIRLPAPHGKLLTHRCPAPNPDLVAPATEVVHHTDLFNEPHRVVQRQDIDQWPEANVLGFSGNRREVRGMARGHRERRVMVLRHMVTVDTTLIGLHQEL